MQPLTAGITKAGTGLDGIVWNILGQTYVPKQLSDNSFAWHATLPPGTFEIPIFDVVLKRITVRGSIVGTRQDLEEAIAFAAAGKVRARTQTAALEDINTVFADLKAGRVTGRMVLNLG